MERIGGKGPNVTWSLFGADVTDFAQYLHLDRPVINKTDITGLYAFRLEFGIDSATASFLPCPPTQVAQWLEGNGGQLSTIDPAGLSIFKAREEQLGLKLEATRGPGAFLVIDTPGRHHHIDEGNDR